MLVRSTDCNSPLFYDDDDDGDGGEYREAGRISVNLQSVAGEAFIQP